jgi:HlyD family secretion protein
MAGSKRVAALLVGIVLVWAGLCQIGPQVPLAGAPRVNPLGVNERLIWRAEVQPQSAAEEISCQVEQPTAILYVAAAGKTVKKGDLLVELDASALVDKRMQQTLDKRKAEGDLLLAEESQDREKRAAAGQIALAEKALRLAQAQLKAFVEGEYPHQLALAEGAAAIAKQKQLMMNDRVEHLRADAKTSNDPATETALQEAEIARLEAIMQVTESQGSLAILKSSLHDNKVAELELAVAQREFDLASAKDALSAATLQGEVARSLAQMSHEIESDRLAQLEGQIQRSKIYAPCDGTVVYPDGTDEAALKPGATAYPRQVLLRLLPAVPSQPTVRPSA